MHIVERRSVEGGGFSHSPRIVGSAHILSMLPAYPTRQLMSEFKSNSSRATRPTHVSRRAAVEPAFLWRSTISDCAVPCGGGGFAGPRISQFRAHM